MKLFKDPWETNNIDKAIRYIDKCTDQKKLLEIAYTAKHETVSYRALEKFDNETMFFFLLGSVDLFGKVNTIYGSDRISFDVRNSAFISDEKKIKNKAFELVKDPSILEHLMRVIYDEYLNYKCISVLKHYPEYIDIVIGKISTDETIALLEKINDIEKLKTLSNRSFDNIINIYLDARLKKYDKLWKKVRFAKTYSKDIYSRILKYLKNDNAPEYLIDIFTHMGTNAAVKAGSINVAEKMISDYRDFYYESQTYSLRDAFMLLPDRTNEMEKLIRMDIKEINILGELVPANILVKFLRNDPKDLYIVLGALKQYPDDYSDKVRPLLSSENYYSRFLAADYLAKFKDEKAEITFHELIRNEKEFYLSLDDLVRYYPNEATLKLLIELIEKYKGNNSYTDDIAELIIKLYKNADNELKGSMKTLNNLSKYERKHTDIGNSGCSHFDQIAINFDFLH